jgi:hypothetical protein
LVLFDGNFTFSTCSPAANMTRYWLHLNTRLLANAIVSIVAFAACLLPNTPGKGTTLFMSWVKHQAYRFPFSVLAWFSRSSTEGNFACANFNPNDCIWLVSSPAIHEGFAPLQLIVPVSTMPFYAEGMSGLVILRAIQMTYLINELVSTALHMDSLMISVERMLNYITCIEQEDEDSDATGAGCAQQPEATLFEYARWPCSIPKTNRQDNALIHEHQSTFKI